MQVLAPAKINLSLRVLGKRADGFHEIETLIVPISLYDVLDVEPTAGSIDFACDDPSLPHGEENLVVRAANAFLAATGVKAGVSISLQKKIPHGAGLGGGSSDAAATIQALNRLFETKLSQNELVKLGSELGSDVPFFLFESAATCTSRGDIIAPTKLKNKMSLLLMKPAFGVASSWAYSRWQSSNEIPGINYGTQQFAGQKFFSDLERPVFEKFVFLAQLKNWLLKQPETGAALMSGSGSTVFAVLRPKANADALADRARAELDGEMWVRACETL